MQENIVYQLTIGRDTYIGCTGQTLGKRLTEHRSDAKRFNHPVQQAIRKVDPFSITAKILFRSASKAKAQAKERELIKALQPKLNVRLK